MLYEELRKRLQLFSLETGRLKEVMSEVYKILKVVDKVNADPSHQILQHGAETFPQWPKNCFLKGWFSAHSSDTIPPITHLQVALEEKGQITQHATA